MITAVEEIIIIKKEIIPEYHQWKRVSSIEPDLRRWDRSAAASSILESSESSSSSVRRQEVTFLNGRYCCYSGGWCPRFVLMIIINLSSNILFLSWSPWWWSIESRKRTESDPIPMATWFETFLAASSSQVKCRSNFMPWFRQMIQKLLPRFSFRAEKRVVVTIRLDTRKELGSCQMVPRWCLTLALLHGGSSTSQVTC